MTKCKETCLLHDRSSSIDQTVLQCRHHEDRGEGTVFHDPRRCGTWQFWRSREGEGEELMSSENSTSRQRSIQSKRMDLWEHEDRSSFGGGSESPSRLLRHRDHVRLLIRWWNLFLCADREWNKQIRDGNDAGNTREPHRWHWRQYRETCCKSKTITNISADDFFANGYVTISPGWLDWRRTRSVRQELFRSVKEDDQIASTRSFSTSRRRRSSRIQNLGTDVSFRIYVFSELVYSNMAELLAKRRRSWEEMSVLCGSILCWYHPVHSSTSRPLWRKTHWSYIAGQRVVTERLCRAHLPRLKLPRCAPDHSIRINSELQRRQERETCGVLYGPEPNVHRPPSRKGLRRDEAQDCSVQTQLENTPKHRVLMFYEGCSK